MLALYSPCTNSPDLLPCFWARSWNPDFAWSSRSLQPEGNFICLQYWTITFRKKKSFFWLIMQRYGSVQTHKAIVSELDYVAHLFVRLSNQIMHSMSAHRLPRYYKPQQVPPTVWTASVTWYKNNKLIRTKILQNFWLILV